MRTDSFVAIAMRILTLSPHVSRMPRLYKQVPHQTLVARVFDSYPELAFRTVELLCSNPGDVSA